ncbi:MAG: glycosyltransferase [Streptococcus sp.]|nr:glycosyltransferase [Streptococcus sp.]
MGSSSLSTFIDDLPKGSSDHYALGFQPPSLRSEDEIMDHWFFDDQPLVSILCATYQHRLFIADAIRGVLGQCTNFGYRLVIRDDASTDGTADIVRAFALRYPRLIVAVCEPRNTFSQGVKPSAAMAQHLTGDFVATCEGDDFWISPHKLQRQIDLLTSNPTIQIACCRSYVIRNGDHTPYSIVPDILPTELFTPDAIMLHGQWPKTLTRVSRRSWYERYLREVPSEAQCDSTFVRYALCTAPQGVNPIGLVDEAMAVYHVHDGGVWSGSTMSEMARQVLRYARFQLTLCDNPAWQKGLYSEYYKSCSVIIRDCSVSWRERLDAISIAMLTINILRVPSFLKSLVYMFFCKIRLLRNFS